MLLKILLRACHNQDEKICNCFLLIWHMENGFKFIHKSGNHSKMSKNQYIMNI